MPPEECSDSELIDWLEEMPGWVWLTDDPYKQPDGKYLFWCSRHLERGPFYHATFREAVRAAMKAESEMKGTS